MALQMLLEQPMAIDFLRPGLGTLLQCFLKIMDDIDFDQLITALQQIVDIYAEEIAPYAI